MTKGVCDLHTFLHKSQVQLTEAGSLIIGYLRTFYKSLIIGQLGDSYYQNSHLTGS